jgi:hypothetical protein
MKTVLLAAFATGLSMTGFAQTDTTIVRTDTTSMSDTIRIGGMVIVRNGEHAHNRKIEISNKSNRRSQSNLSTNWWVVDLGFNNVNDNTNYGSAEAQAFAGPGITNKEGLSLRTGKSVNVNVWFFMQRLNLARHVVNLKYGLGLELNNYHFDNSDVRITKNPAHIGLETGGVSENKNKLAADYITVPMMLNFNFTPGRNHGFGFSAGVSAGYLYSSRQKIKVGNNKDKTDGNLGLDKWKLAYIGELSLGPVRLYGSYAMKSMWDKGLDQTPYAVGIRLSRW